MLFVMDIHIKVKEGNLQLFKEKEKKLRKESRCNKLKALHLKPNRLSPNERGFWSFLSLAPDVRDLFFSE